MNLPHPKVNEPDITYEFMKIIIYFASQIWKKQNKLFFSDDLNEFLAGHRYVLRDDHPYCIKCYENVFANNCDECGKIIGIDSKVGKENLNYWINY